MTAMVDSFGTVFYSPGDDSRAELRHGRARTSSFRIASATPSIGRDRATVGLC